MIILSYITWFETIVSLINIHIIMTLILPGTLERKKAIAMTVIVLPCIVASAFQKTLIGQTAALICLSLTFVMPVFTVKNIRAKQKLYISLLYIGISLALMQPFILIFGSQYIVDFFVNLSLLVLSILIARRVFFPRLTFYLQLISRSHKAILLVSVWLSALLAYMLSQLFHDYNNLPNVFSIKILSALVVILIGLLCPFLIISSISRDYYKSILSNIDNQMQIQAKCYEVLQKADEEIRTFKHDFRNMGISLAESLANNDCASAYQRLQEFNASFEIKPLAFETGNSVADALLTDKQEMAPSVNANIVFNGYLPNGYIAPSDLCVILGNALDNALEACAAIPYDLQKQITIDAVFQNNFLFVIIQNPVLRDVLIRGNIIPTTKKDYRSHGIGLYSIQNAVRKYCGSMSTSCENCVFTMELILDLNDEFSNESTDHPKKEPALKI